MLANVRWDLIRRLKGCMKNQQIHQLINQFINYVWQLLHVSALHCHFQGGFLVPSERCSIEKQLIEYCGWALEALEALETFPEDGNVMLKHAEDTIHN